MEEDAKMKVSNHLALYIGGLSAVAFSLAASDAKAQDFGRELCREVGQVAFEPLGDRQDHALSRLESSCKTKDGLTAGAVRTMTELFEWNGTTATLVSAYGVDHGPGGGVMAFQAVDAKIDATMTAGGRPIGWTGSGHSIVTLASGPWEALKGKTISWTSRSTGELGEYEIISTLQ
jgi:hypothetical protein